MKQRLLNHVGAVSATFQLGRQPFFVRLRVVPGISLRSALCLRDPPSARVPARVPKVLALRPQFSPVFPSL